MILSKKTFATTLALLALLFPLTAQSHTLANLGFTDEQKTSLRAGSTLQNTAQNADNMQLLPQGVLKPNLMVFIGTLPSRDVVETVTLIPTPRQTPPLVLLTGLLNTPSLSGMQYFSRREKINKTLIYDAFVIDSPTNRVRIDPPSPRNLPESLEMYIWQNDETFDEKVYRVVANTHGPSGEILLFNTNVDRLGQGPITMAHPGEMRSFAWFIPTSDGLLIYQTVVNAQSIPGFVRKNAHESMFNRLAAFTNWVKEKFPS